MYMKNILTIAGYDPSSGAGITRDLDIFFSLGIHGVSVPTCTVIQGPQGVKKVYPTPQIQFIETLETITKEVHIDGVKIGVVWDEFFIKRLLTFLREGEKVPIVVDPVIAAKNGRRLLTEKGLQRFIESILPLTSIVTPNIDEAFAITGKKIKGIKDMKGCAKTILEMGPKAVVIKGGHLDDEPVDLLYDGKGFTLWKKKRLERNIHGTGCMFSSLMVSFLVLGYPVREAFFSTERAMEDMLKGSYRIDGGGYFYSSSGILNSTWARRWKTLESMREAQKKLYEMNAVELIPEVQMNVGYAIEGAEGTEDVAAFPGRIGHHEGRIYGKGEPRFGASSHVARLILTFMKYYPHIRSCVNLRYDKAIVRSADEKGMSVVFFDRKKEPKGVKGHEGKSLDFLVDNVLKRTDSPPDIIYDLGDIGKEPIIRLFARDPLELIEKMEMIRP
jgi:hydroxymethylpyrimidine/phosphomethylpyrimidine kinase